MIARTCTLPSVLLVLASGATAQMQIVQQTRAISGTSHAHSSGGSQNDSFNLVAPDAAPFQAFDTAECTVPSASASSEASQTSQLSGDRITAHGLSGAAASSLHESGVAQSSGQSDLSVTFQLTETVEYSMTGSISRTGNASDATIELRQNGVPFHSVSFPSGNHQLSFEFHGVLAPGSYSLTATTRTDESALGLFYTVSGGGVFHLEFALDPLSGTPFCAGDGTGAACPCANDSVPGARVGCLNSLGTGGKLRAGGTASLSNDTLVLHGSQMPNTSALYFQGTLAQNGGNGATFGDGKRCAGGTTTRLGEKNNVMGASYYPSPGNLPVSSAGSVTSPGTRTYQVWYRNAATYCTAATFNLTNGVEVTWGA
jgi:hypothetical protein